MAEIEPPSFSLGLDFELDSNSDLPIPIPCQAEAPDSPIHHPSASNLPGPGSPPSLFRRLRRGISTKPAESPLPSVVRASDCSVFDVDADVDEDDDIEEFSSDELGSLLPDEQTAAKVQSACSSGTKLSLQGRGIVTKQPYKETCRKRKQDLDAPSTSSVVERIRPIFSELNRSPLRRFQLIDSDSESDDTPSHSGDTVVLSSGFKHASGSKSSAAGGKSDPSALFSKKVDFWKDFRPVEACNVATPVLDEFCKEYFRTPRDMKTGSDAPCGFSQTQRGERERASAGAEKLKQTDPGHALPPAHRYFFNDDPTIRSLVRSRLCHFQPLGPVNNVGSQHLNESVIDYRGQFSEEISSPKQKDSARANPKTSSRKIGNSSKSSRGKRTANPNDEWISPKSAGNIPKDASKRRVHATGGSPGVWHTDNNGIKIYVSKSGQELTGRIAYRCYKKESGTGFGKPKKKRAARKKK